MIAPLGIARTAVRSAGAGEAARSAAAAAREDGAVPARPVAPVDLGAEASAPARARGVAEPGDDDARPLPRNELHPPRLRGDREADLRFEGHVQPGAAPVVRSEVVRQAKAAVEPADPAVAVERRPCDDLVAAVTVEVAGGKVDPART